MPYVLPDIELWATGYLRAGLAPDVYVSNEIPSTHQARMVIVRRDGGAGTRVLDKPLLSIRVFNDDPEAIESDVATVRSLMLRAAGNGPVRRVTENGGPLTIPDQPQPERLMSYDLVTRGANA